ncbi:GNAT family N-acetyltransferase [Micromonospora sp. WMMD712]|uniref:GNAT family N-acetyltransferase n=1 Tax=Micromonospora sp. WMMD712 TaxID=3016096 RepID=UPI00249BC00C|nr:GNAT family N-acetyltransferase [Micromonospora sp. WMMD712]WFE56985.1 GNAT family N-acetyltransferase [Micromonospora sp. WMMD712]
MTPTVRPFADADADAVSGVLRAGLPHLLATPELLCWQVARAQTPERFGALVAEVDGVPVGVARTGLLHESAEPGRGFVNLTVRPDRRGRGAGSALLAAAEQRLVGLGATTAYAMVDDTPADLAFAERHGYRRGRRSLLLRCDLSVPPPPPAPGPGVRLLAAADLPDPRALYAADLDVSRDEPGEVGMDEIAYADWLAAYWHRPDLDRELTTVAVADGEVVAFTVGLTDSRHDHRCGMTGTRRPHRRRGLARLVKQAALRRAAAAGFRHSVTVIDAGNAAMLGLNETLGYRPVAAQWRYRRDLPS